MRRSGGFLLATVLAAGSACAALTEIPTQSLEKESRTRRSLSPAARARVDALAARLTTQMSVADVKALAGGETGDTLFLVMLQYLKMLQKEAREDRKVSDSSARAGSVAKEFRLELEKTKIVAMRTEAGEKFNRAMSSADVEMALGISSGVAALNTVYRVPTRTLTRPPITSPTIKVR